MKNDSTSPWLKISLYVFYGLLAYMPLHILLSTWIGTSFDVLEFARVAKEGLLLAGAFTALVLGFRAGVARQLLQDKLMWLIASFALLNVLLAVWRSTDLDAELLGLAYNTRFLVFFVWAAILARLYPKKNIISTAVKVVLISGAITVVFGLAQYIFLPDDALTRLGYQRSNGVLPAFFIDDKPDLERIMSTVRDPNSYGSYLIIIISLLVSGLLLVKGKAQLRSLLFTFGSFIALFWTFSRSAWLGVLAALLVVGAFYIKRHNDFLSKYKKPISIAVLSVVIIAGGVLAGFWNSYWVQNVVFHADEATVLEDPNQLRARFWQESIDDIAANPLGSGPGTAGLASIRNDEKTVLNENYYLQMGQELGVVGLVLFLAIILTVAWRLYSLGKAGDVLAIALLASFAGLMITNFLVHIWANEAVAYTWWGLTGLVLAIRKTT